MINLKCYNQYIILFRHCIYEYHVAGADCNSIFSTKEMEKSKL